MLDYSIALMFLFLVPSALMDVVWKRVPNKFIMVPLLCGAAWNIYRFWVGEEALLLVSTFSFTIMLLLWKIGWFGGADAKTLIWMSLLNPVMTWFSLLNSCLAIPFFTKIEKDIRFLVPLLCGFLTATIFGSLLHDVLGLLFPSAR